MDEPLKHNEGVGFTYTVTMEQMRKHAGSCAGVYTGDSYFYV
jgi:hypothetical protein